MPARRYSLCLLILLLIAGPALLPSSAHGAMRRCDARVLPRADTLSVEAAARKATAGKLPDIHVQMSCITNTTTSVSLIRPNPTDSSSRREQWQMTCDREQSTWYKRGGWQCDSPRLTRDMDAKAAFLGAQSTLLISFDGSMSFETAEGLARRALLLFENEASAPARCSALPAPNEPDWKKMRELELHGADTSKLNVEIEVEGDIRRVLPLGWSSGMVFDFQRAAAADPANAPACWDEQVIVD